MAGSASLGVPVASLLFLLMTGLSPSPARSLDTDAGRLLKFKAGISDPAGSLKNWSADTSPCEGDKAVWTGVICDAGSVLGLKLENMGLSGTLSLDPLEGLLDLRTLSFMGNAFEGPMPNLQKLQRLWSVYLSSNKLSGKIPDDAFAGMRALKKVYLSQNSFSGTIPPSLASLPRLMELRLDSNKFDGAIPGFPQKGLVRVNVSQNALEGTIPEGFSAMDAGLFAGNKGLCGPPLQLQCNQRSPATAPASLDASPAPAKKRFSTPVLIALGVAIEVTVVAAGLTIVMLRRRSARATDERLGHRQSTKKGLKEERLDEGPEEGQSTKKGREHEQGRLVFPREATEEERFELQDLLKASAEVLQSAPGSLGCCYKATLLSGRAVVVKRFREMNRVGREEFEEHMRRLGRLSHPNLLPLVAYYYRKEEKLLVTDYVCNRSLANLLHGANGAKNAALDWATRLKIIKGVARGLAFLYDELPVLTVPHGHLKSSNVLLDQSYKPLLSDYALVPVATQSCAANLMVAFKSPERKQFGKPTKKSDVWSLGLLILEALTGKPPAFDQQGKAGCDLVGWISSTAEGEWATKVLACEIRGEENNQGDMLKLLKIGLACCEVDVDKRLETKDALDKIEELGERDGSTGKRSMNDDDFSSVSIN